MTSEPCLTWIYCIKKVGVKWQWETKSTLPRLWASQLCPSLGLTSPEQPHMNDWVDLVGCTLLDADAGPAPMVCCVFLRPRPVALSVPKIRSPRWGKFLHTHYRYQKILLQKCSLSFNTHLGTLLGALVFLVCKKHFKIQPNCQNWHPRRCQFDSSSLASKSLNCFAEGTKGSWSIGSPEMEAICAV